MPRWTPPSLGPSSETSSSSKSQALSAAVLVPDAAALKEGLNGEGLSSPGAASEPVVGTPDGEPGMAWGTVASPLSVALASWVSSGQATLQGRESPSVSYLCLSLPLTEHIHFILLH